jgi:hypothetical protein
MDNVEKRLEMLDQRLDNIDSIVTALVERIMKQPVTVQLTCPKCGAEVQIMMTSTAKTINKGKS